MKLVVIRQAYKLIDATNTDDRKYHELQPGEYQVERAANPFGHTDAPWIVLKGTKIGAAEGSIRQWCSGENDPNPPWVKLYDDNGVLLPDNNKR